MDLTEAEHIKKRWQEYTELYKKDLHDLDNCNDMITHLEPDILESKFKWALGSITTNKDSGGGWISVELFQIPKDDAVKVLYSICQQMTLMATGPEKVSFHPNPKERQCQRMFKLHTTSLISHASKVMLKNPQARLQQYMNQESPDYKLDLEKAEEPEMKLPTSIGP